MRNSEGYWDPTAELAIARADRATERRQQMGNKGEEKYIVNGDKTKYLTRMDNGRYKGYLKLPNGKYDNKVFVAHTFTEAQVLFMAWCTDVEARRQERMRARAVARGRAPEEPIVLGNSTVDSVEPEPQPEPKEEPMPPKKVEPTYADEIYLIVFRNKPIKYTESQDQALSLAEALNDTLKESGIETNDRYDVTAVKRWAA